MRKIYDHLQRRLTRNVPIQLEGGYVGYPKKGRYVECRGCIKAVWGVD